jgi:hypothetical protein
MTCAQVGEASTEYALGILPGPEAAAVAAHLLTCPACRREVEEIRGVGDRLLDLVPDAEPPLGFDLRTLSAVEGPPVTEQTRRRPSRTRRIVFAVAAVAAAAAVVTGGVVAADHAVHHAPDAARLDGVLWQGKSKVGTVYVTGHPSWVSMSVSHLSFSGTVSCELVGKNGQVFVVGAFDLVDGSGTWSAPGPAAGSSATWARVVGPDGTVLADAALKVSST